MRKTKFDYSTQHYFPKNVKFLGILFLLFGLALFASGKFLASSIFLFLSIFIFITRYGISIDLNKKTYLDYLSFLGYKKGTTEQFDTIESIYITKGRKTVKMQLRAASNTISKDEYNGYIKFDGEKVHLLSSDHKEEVEKILNSISRDLNVPLRDYSNER